MEPMPRRIPAPPPWRFLTAPPGVRLTLAADPAADAELLTVIAPPAQEARREPALTGLVVTVLRHPACPPAVAARNVGHPDVGVRRLVLDVDGLPATALDSLAYDPDSHVSERARALLSARERDLR